MMMTRMVFVLAIFNPGFAHAVVSKKCEKAVLASIKSIDEQSVFPTIEVECQYYRVNELNEEVRKKLHARFNRSKRMISDEAKLSTVLGELKAEVIRYAKSEHQAGESCVTNECRPGKYRYFTAKEVALKRDAAEKSGTTVSPSLYEMSCVATSSDRISGCKTR